MLSADEIAALVRDAQGGSAVAFTRLAHTFSRAVYAIALAHLGRVSDAEDIAQDTLMSALSEIRSCREPARFGAWLLRIARNRARNALARRKHADVAVDVPREIAIGADQERALLRSRLIAALDTLSPIQREVVLLHDLDGWTHRDIAASLELTEDGSRQHLSRARRSLRDHLGAT